MSHRSLMQRVKFPRVNSRGPIEATLIQSGGYVAEQDFRELILAAPLKRFLRQPYALLKIYFRELILAAPLKRIARTMSPTYP